MKEEIRDEINKSVDNNMDYMKKLLENCSDVIFRDLYAGEYKVAFVYIDGMEDKVLINDYVIESLMQEGHRAKSVQDLKDRVITVTDIREIDKLGDGVLAMLSGDTLMFLEGMSSAYVLASRAWPTRGIQEPSGETVVRGSREGFTETIRFNTALVRRRIRDTRFKIERHFLGTRSKSDIVVMYIDDIVNKDILAELETRLDKIHIDAILDSGYVEQMIEDNEFSPFPQVQSTERPDVVAQALYEGRVAVLIDNSPFALIVPATLPVFFQTPDDYNQRWLHSSLVRILRLMAIILSLILPALYVAVTAFHTSIIPTKLAYSIAASREGVPFPSFVEAIIMEISLAFLIEAVVRLPRPIGSTIGIVGGLIIGQAAVSAGIVSPIMIIIVSITSITSFITPNYAVTSAFRLLRFLLILAAAVIGMYGIMVGLLLILIHLLRLESFGVPYMSPIANIEFQDLKDVFIRFPFNKLKNRPRYMRPEDKIRQE